MTVVDIEAHRRIDRLERDTIIVKANVSLLVRELTDLDPIEDVDDSPAACLPGEEPLLDLDTFERAGQLVATATIPIEERVAEVPPGR